MSKTTQRNKQTLRTILYLLIILVPGIVIIPITQWLLPDPVNPMACVRAAMGTKNYSAALDCLTDCIKQDPLSVKYHYLYLQVHFEQDEKERDDAQVLDRYSQWANHPDPNTADIGYFGQGQFYLNTGRPDESLGCFDKIANPKLAYLYKLRGRALLQQCDFPGAEAAFRQEIENGGDVRGAVGDLARMLEDLADDAGIEALYDQPELRKNFPPAVIRRMAIRRGWIGTYLLGQWTPFWSAGNWIGIAGAGLILLVWMLFLKKLDPFEPEKPVFVVLTVGLGMLFSFVAIVLYDFYELTGFFQLGRSGFGDLLYCICRIGFIEEAVKLLPVLILIGCTRQVDESNDYLIYASLGALGFAFMENILYFKPYSLLSMKGRGMICCTGHMFYTSLVLYGIVLAKYRKKGTMVGNFVLFFLAACVLHGVYDFLLISDFLPAGFSGLAFLQALIEAVLYVRILNNTLNQSEFFDSSKIRQFRRMREFLGAALMAIVLFEYIGAAIQYGPRLTSQYAIGVIGFTWFLVLFFSSALGTYKVRRGHWQPVLGRDEKPEKA